MMGTPETTRLVLKIIYLGSALVASVHGNVKQEGAIPNTNPCLPAAYNFQQYAFPEPADNVACSGVQNASAVIQKVHFAQTHVMAPDWPFFFLVAGRPALVVVSVTGAGPSPQVKVDGWIGDVPVGTLCLRGPGVLPAAVDIQNPNFTDRFTVTLPKVWIQPGLRVTVTAGNAVQNLTAAQLGVRFSPEVNLTMLPMDILNYNDGNEDKLPRETFLADFASEMPATQVRFGIFPARVKMPTMVVSPDFSNVNEYGLHVINKRLCKRNESPGALCMDGGEEIAAGMINGAASRMIGAIMKATGDHTYTIYYGNTESLNPGGWGGGRSFVAADFTNVMIHEAGHALSLPHWGQGSYNKENPGDNDYRYPYGGVPMDGGGRGDTWNYYQSTGQFITPKCLDDRKSNFGDERADAMFRTAQCNMYHGDKRGPWDGFSDFSSYAMFRFMTGAEAQGGMVPYGRTGGASYHLKKQRGYPNFKVNGAGQCELIRETPLENKPQNEYQEFLIPHQRNVSVHTIYGTYHPAFGGANLIYPPMTYLGNLPKVIDPTNPQIFEALKEAPYRNFFGSEKDLTFKFIYEDNSVLHALYPHGNVNRNWSSGKGIWRNDLLYWAISIPGEKGLKRIEMYRRPFTSRSQNNTTEGNINNPSFGITAGNFMSGAALVAAVDVNAQGLSVEPGISKLLSENPFRILLGEGAPINGVMDSPHKADLFNLQGKQLGTTSFNSGGTAEFSSNSLANLPRGVYVIRVYGKGAPKTFRVPLH